MNLLIFIPLVLCVPSAAAIDRGCRKQVRQCVALPTTECLGISLAYNLTAPGVIFGSSQMAEVLRELSLWKALYKVPDCWDAIQPLLCSAYLPKCHQNGSDHHIELLDYAQCESVKERCAVLLEANVWPEFLDCEKPHFISDSQCELRKERQGKRLNTTSSCIEPLIPSSADSYLGFKGCTLPCHNPQYTASGHLWIHVLTAACAVVCLLCASFAVMTFVLDWRHANRYPALTVFFLSLCLCVSSVGWLLQLVPGVRDAVVCRADGTRRMAEPQNGSGGVWCMLVFILIYYPTIASLVWFVVLCYTLHVSFRAESQRRSVEYRKKGLFHIAAWLIPLVMTVICITIQAVEGDSLTGVCFVSRQNPVVYSAFVLLPTALCMIVGTVLLLRGVHTLWNLAKDTELLQDKGRVKLRLSLWRLGVFVGIVMVTFVVMVTVHVYLMLGQSHWDDSFRTHMTCSLGAALSGRAVGEVCAPSDKPSAAITGVLVLAYCSCAVSLTAWQWTRATVKVWQRFVMRRLLKVFEEQPPKLHKHRFISMVYAKREDLNHGRVSLSLHSSHDDPMDLRLYRYSSSSVSSTLAAALPRLVARRGAIIGLGNSQLKRSVSADGSASRRSSSGSHTSVWNSENSVVGKSPSDGQRHASGDSASRAARRHRHRRRPRPGGLGAASSTSIDVAAGTITKLKGGDERSLASLPTGRPASYAGRASQSTEDLVNPKSGIVKRFSAVGSGEGGSVKAAASGSLARNSLALTSMHTVTPCSSARSSELEIVSALSLPDDCRLDSDDGGASDLFRLRSDGHDSSAVPSSGAASETENE